MRGNHIDDNYISKVHFWHVPANYSDILNFPFQKKIKVQNQQYMKYQENIKKEKD